MHRRAVVRVGLIPVMVKGKRMRSNGSKTALPMSHESNTSDKHAGTIAKNVGSYGNHGRSTCDLDTTLTLGVGWRENLPPFSVGSV
jgi:hypothetical protein